MGSIYRQQYRLCVTCKLRLTTTNKYDQCVAEGHDVQTRTSQTWTIAYTRNKTRYFESTGTTKKTAALAVLKSREGDIAHGKPVTPQIGRLTFDDAAADLLSDYRVNAKKSLISVERKIRKHLTPFFGGEKMSEITTTTVRQFVEARQTANTVLVRQAHVDESGKRVPEVRRPASNAEINRELAPLKRMFSLAVQAGTLLHRPHIPMLRESAARAGFFDAEQFSSVRQHLPAEIRPVVEFAYLTGWRIAAEVLTLEWRQVDMRGEMVRLDAAKSKNAEARLLPFNDALRGLFRARWAEHERLKKAGHVVPWVFFREIAEGRGGDKKPRRITSFNKAWKVATVQAGCPGRLPHDLRRSAIRNLVRAGVSETTAMKISGHKTASTFRRYNITSTDDLRDAMRRVDTPARRRQSR